MMTSETHKKKREKHDEYVIIKRTCSKEKQQIKLGE